MDRFAALTGRQYHLFDYVGAPDAERVIVADGLRRRDRRGDGERTSAARGEKVGVLKVRLYRPFAVGALLDGAAADDARNRRARPHQGAGQRRRAALPGRGHGDQRGVSATA